MKKLILIALLCVVATACASSSSVTVPTLTPANKAKLAAAVTARSEEEKARDGARNPQETLEFFGITSNMTVVEVLPGGGWYSKILAPYLAGEGALYGVNYSDETWPMFGFFTAEQIAQTQARTVAYPTTVEEFAGQPINARGMSFGAIDPKVNGTVDAVLFIRALHNLHRFESNGGTLMQALNETSAMLKRGGIVGVVQHVAPESSSDAWADGGAGYLKKSRLLQFFDQAGYDFAGESMINGNLKDNPNENDTVWRLPPSMRTGALEGDAKAAAQAAVKVIGESNRVTLKFTKR